MNEKLLSLLGLIRRAKRLSFGFESSAQTVKSGKAKLILIACDVSAKTEKEIRFLCEKSAIPAVRADFTMAQLSSAIGIKAGLVSITDTGFAEKSLSLCKDYGEE